MVGLIVQMDKRRDKGESKGEFRSGQQKTPEKTLWGLFVVAWAGFEPAAKGL